MSVRTESSPKIVHHASMFTGFEGTIQLDAESNRYLNLTLHVLISIVLKLFYLN